MAEPHDDPSPSPPIRFVSNGHVSLPSIPTNPSQPAGTPRTRPWPRPSSINNSPLKNTSTPESHFPPLLSQPVLAIPRTSPLCRTVKSLVRRNHQSTTCPPRLTDPVSTLSRPCPTHSQRQPSQEDAGSPTAQSDKSLAQLHLPVSANQPDSQQLLSKFFVPCSLHQATPGATHSFPPLSAQRRDERTNQRADCPHHTHQHLGSGPRSKRTVSKITMSASLASRASKVLCNQLRCSLWDARAWIVKLAVNLRYST